MSTAADAATATAQTTEDGTEAAPKVPGRSEVLAAFAREAMGEPEPAAPDAPAAGVNADEALSQTAAAAATDGETPEEKAAREAAEAEANAEGDENHLEEELRQGLPPETQEKINRRIGKEVAKTKAEREQREAAEARAAELEARMAETPAAKVQSPEQLGHIHDAGKLNAEKVRAESALEQSEDLLVTLEDSPEDVASALRAAKIELKDENGEDDYSAGRMRKFLRGVRQQADRTLRTAIPKREEFLKVAENNAKAAVQLMPELNEAKSERRKLFNQVLRENPEVMKTADWPLKAVAAVVGMEWLKAQADAKTKAANGAQPKKRELPVSIPTPRAQAPRVEPPKTEKLNAGAIADAMLSGDRSARLKILTGMVPVK